ncbi:hypothetical protein LCGC14_1335050 [marine sediment metagenome]|uniref:VOC domain-containing protein n=1 Tax=marine sediment metagenome TaxID=412755 RepID=A0A0F9MWC0_9ZZZZ
MHSATAPHEIGSVTLVVHDLARVAAFYEIVIGLHRLAADRASVTLGAGGRALLRLRADPAAQRRDRREAGLFHTAFLMPGRADLGRWLHHAAHGGHRLSGASDHLVSEALYLDDPEGNGIELYADRPRGQWSHDADGVVMATGPLDLEGLAGSADGDWVGAPDATVVGHVHLQVGALAPAERFITETLGFALTKRYPGAAFFGSGGYHHHLAANIWASDGAGPRDLPATGLAEVEILTEAPTEPAMLHDPWGTRFALRPKAG